MADSPVTNSDGVVRVSIRSGGQPIPATIQPIELAVHRQVNAIPSARLVVLDGDMPSGKFEVSDGPLFQPGAEIEILAGYGDSEETIFKGVVVRHGVKITEDNDSRLVVECRDKAVKMTVGRRNANFVDSTDSDLIAKLVGNHGLTAKIDATPTQHAELVQYGSTDWDFVISRAEVNGFIVIVEDATVSAQAPKTGAAPVLTVTYGTDLMEFHADIDARTQFTTVKTSSWNAATQTVLTQSGGPETLNSQGNLDSSTLAGVIGLASYDIRTAAALEANELKDWAQAQQVKSGLARVRGRMTFQGSAKARVGGMIEVQGVGERFNGNAFVTAVHHAIRDGNWVTEVDFGASPEWFVEKHDVSLPATSGWIPAVSGLQVGVVKKLDEDPGGEHRVQVSVPVMEAETDGVWARLMTFYASNGFGTFFVPEVGDEVVLGFFNDEPSSPVILGSLYSSKNVPPYALSAGNDTKAVVTRCKAKVEFDDAKKIITVRTPAGNSIVLSDDGKSIAIQDQNDNQVTLNEGGISISSPKDVEITAKGKITLSAVGAVTIESKADVQSKGLNVSCEAQVGFTGKGSATAELSASGTTTVKGAMVMIN
ncbi:MAG: type VI secretion system tip protein VgrG [Betaproteobacteria bacterium]|nr:type VI secretion system tip protein VgrG [Betaproteobacteria bacterium]